MYTFTLSNTDILKEDSMNFELLSTSFHGPGPSGSSCITGIDVCIWKPLVVTCGRDRTVRVWNYQERAVELMKEFPEEAQSVAMHPSGLYVLAGFADKVRLMSLLMDDIRPVKELQIKNCRELAFAHGGHCFAVANNTLVQIINTYTCEVIVNLRGHNGKVRSVVWGKGDRKIMTVGMDGAVFIWSVRQGVKESEHVQPRTAFHAGVATPELSRIFTVSSDQAVKEFVSAPGGAGAAAPTLAPQNTVSAETALGAVCLTANQRVLLVGTCEPGRPGLILAHAMLPQLSAQAEPQQYLCHASELSCMRLSHDGTYLFTAGEDGSLCMFEVHDIDTRGQVRSRERDGAAEFTEEILVTKSDLEEKASAMQQLRNKVDELVLNNEYQLRLKDMKYKERIKEVSDKFTSELSSDAQRYDQLIDEKRTMEDEYEEKLRELEEKHNAEFRELETQYNAKINTEVARYQALLSEREDQNRKWDEDNQALVDTHTSYLQELTNEYDRKMEDEQEMQRRLADEKEAMMGQFVKRKTHIEGDADFEVEEVKQKYEAKLAAERELTIKLKMENGVMKKKFSALTKDVEDQKEEIRSLHEKEKELIETIKGLEKDIQGHKKEIREREETIADKEKRIYDLKKKNQELEKFKFVLDYKIKELKRQIEPRENEIADMRKQVEEMDMELEQYHKSNSALDLMIGELRLKMDGMQKEINGQKTLIADGAAYVTRFRRDLQQCVASLDQHRELKQGVRELYKQYVLEEFSGGGGEGGGGGGGGGDGAGGGEGELQHEYNRQREHLERNVEALKRNIAKDVEMYLNDHARLMRESVTLTGEMNELRREAQQLRLKQRALVSALTAPPPAPDAPAFGMEPSPPPGGPRSKRPGGAHRTNTEAHRELEMQEQQIERLLTQARELEGALPLGGPEAM